MLENLSEKSKQKFISLFVKELILIKKIQLLKKMKLEQEKLRIQKAIEEEKLKQKYLEKKPENQLVKKEENSQPSIFKKQVIIEKIPLPPAIKTANIKLPLILNTSQVLANLGKIIPLINDLSISYIECTGADNQLIIKKNNQKITTEIRLNEEEINLVIKDFSEKARIPLIEGLLKARVSNHEISAVVSKVSSSRFIIVRTNFQPIPRPPMQIPLKPTIPQIKKLF